jgi:hypothetical protein
MVDKIIRKMPVLNIAFGLIVLFVFGLSTALGTSILLGLLMLSMLSVGYKIRIDDHNKTINTKGFIILALTVTPVLIFGFYFGLSYIFS